MWFSKQAHSTMIYRCLENPNYALFENSLNAVPVMKSFLMTVASLGTEYEGPPA